MLRKLTAGVAALGLALVPGSAGADPEPGGQAGSGAVAVLSSATDVNPTVEPQPVPTLENGAPMFLAQDGGDGEHASMAVTQGLRDLIDSGNYNSWELETGETGLSDADQTVFYLKAGNTYFRVTVAPDPTVAPE
jgi:hypothetical protein